MLRALQELASRWQATIVAEGVETAEQLAAIRDLGITAGQGYLLDGRPAKRRVEPIDIEACCRRAGSSSPTTRRPSPHAAPARDDVASPGTLASTKRRRRLASATR